MKKQAFNPFYQAMSISRTGSRECSGIVCMCMEATMHLTVRITARMIMSAGQRRWMTWGIGNLKGLYTNILRIPYIKMQMTIFYRHRMQFRDRTAGITCFIPWLPTDIISVAVCDSPAGQYEFYGHVHYEDGTVLGKKDTDLLQFDPGIYVEDNRVYLYSGFCPPNTFMWEMQGKKAPAFKGAMVIELYPDMVTVKKAPEIIAPYVKNSSGTGYEGHEFFEAPSMRKKGDKYYFIYSSINGHELCYAMSDYPDKGFAYCGTIVSNADIGLEGRTSQDAINYYGNNHGSIVEILGQWYIFYHRHTNRNQFSRQACAEKNIL